MTSRPPLWRGGRKNSLTFHLESEHYSGPIETEDIVVGGCLEGVDMSPGHFVAGNYVKGSFSSKESYKRKAEGHLPRVLSKEQVPEILICWSQTISSKYYEHFVAFNEDDILTLFRGYLYTLMRPASCE
jgi:hypothetical protein